MAQSLPSRTPENLSVIEKASMIAKMFSVTLIESYRKAPQELLHFGITGNRIKQAELDADKTQRLRQAIGNILVDHGMHEAGMSMMDKQNERN
ncbi:MAG: hypothetical protein WA843_02975 [Candidatus Saccharimonadales bacterium]